ncbi:MAG: hypothetical protein HY822_07305 [Acidobacteria bacterium]|nr:hypothetical protein [Acidobacteriota bacterium]
MTERLYYRDAYAGEFRAAVVETAGQGLRVYLDRTAFYPASGGQPCDLGWIDNVAVTEVADEGERIAHVLAAPLSAGEVAGRLDWVRRFDHMQQHTGQHLLSAALVELCQARTVGFHLGQEISTIDVDAASLDARQVAAVERRVNELVFENRPVAVSFEDAAAAAGLRKASEREGELRIVSIRDYDRSACGGTHVRATGEIGPVLVRKLEKIRGNLRLEFLCGGRAVRRARADFEALSRIAHAHAAALDEAPKLVAAAIERLSDAGKALRKMAAELALIRGRELCAATAPDPSGVRRHFRRLAAGALDDELRALAQGFTAGEKAVFVAVSEDSCAVMLAASKDAGVNAGAVLKQAVAAQGGRGGGSPAAAQGSVPDAAALARVVGGFRAAGLIAG